MNQQKSLIIAVALGGLVLGLALSPFVNSSFGRGGWGMMGWRWDSDKGGRYGMMGNIDRSFIEGMIPHHDDAIAMAELALTKAEHAEIKTLAENIKRSQTEENEKMRAWYREWFGVDVSPLSSSYGMGMGHGMMGGGMMGDESDILSLQNAKPFDKAFIEEMIPHHQMAVMMATMLIRATDRPEMKALGEAIIEAQTREINQMREWYRVWYGG